MWRHELIDPDHRHAAGGQLAARGAAHRAQTDDDHIGLTNLDMIAVELVARPSTLVARPHTDHRSALREEGFTGRVVLIGREPGVPFGRPPLTKTYIRSEEDLEGWYVRPPGWYGEHDVERLESSVVAVDAPAHLIMLDSGQELEYQKVLIATGGRNR
jgi:hypothetical protein